MTDEERRRWEAEADEEQTALSRHPRFRSLLAKSRESARRNGTISIEEMRAFQDLTPEEEADGDRLLAELERQTEEEGTRRSAAKAS